MRGDDILDAASEEDVLALTVYGEARGEEALGWKAVAWVVRNRVAGPRWWGTDIKSVCLHPFQFSCWNRHDPNRKKLLTIAKGDEPPPSPYGSIRAATDAVLAAPKKQDPTNGATHYHSIHLHPPPPWAGALHQCARIGRHLFYRT